MGLATTDNVAAATHCVLPPGKRTSVSIEMDAKSGWILPTQWLQKSSEKGKLLPEKKFAAEKKNTYKGKMFHLTPGFIQECSRSKDKVFEKHSSCIHNDALNTFLN